LWDNKQEPASLRLIPQALANIIRGFGDSARRICVRVVYMFSVDKRNLRGYEIRSFYFL